MFQRKAVRALEGQVRGLETGARADHQRGDRLLAMLTELADALGYEWTYNTAPDFLLERKVKPRKGKP
jgi:hypothetical protein